MRHVPAIVFILVLSLSITFVCQRKALFNKYVFEDDCNQYIFPHYRISDSLLFDDDIFYDYSLRHNTRGVILIYTLFSHFIDPLLFSKILPFVLCFLSALYIFLVGEKMKDAFVGFLADLIFIMHSWTFSCFAGGHAKSFVFPLLLSFIFYLMQRKYLFVAIILSLQIVIYPPIAAVSLLSLLLLSFLIFKQSNANFNFNSEIKFYIFVVAAGVFSLYFLYLMPDPFKGPLFKLSEASNMPEFFYGGRTPHFISSLRMLKEDNIAENITGLPVYSFPTWILLAISFVGFILLLMKKITIHPILNAFCISGVLLFFGAWVMFFQLYSPGRYLKFAPLVFLIFLSALTINKIFLKGEGGRLRFFFLPLIIILVYLPFLKDETRYFKNEGLYNFLSTLPKNVLIAGHPEEMDEIPLISKRKVFVQFELSLPYYKSYYKKIAERTKDFFRLYYSESNGEVINICNRYHIDYLVIKKAHFRDTYLGQKVFYIEPFNDYIQQIVAKNIKKGFVFQNVSPQYRVYEDNEFFVVSANDLAFL